MYRIVEEYLDYCFLIRNEYTGIMYEVVVPPSLRVLYTNKQIFSELPEACPFLRRDDRDGFYYCTVHHTRPDICREYRCWRFLILDKNGNQAGRIMGNRHLHAIDPDLHYVWDRDVRTLVESDDDTWDLKMVEIIQEAGYQVRK